jgi:hypothetical protein
MLVTYSSTCSPFISWATTSSKASAAANSFFCISEVLPFSSPCSHLLTFAGGIITSLTSMAYSHYVKHGDRPAHGASGKSAPNPLQPYSAVTSRCCLFRYRCNCVRGPKNDFPVVRNHTGASLACCIRPLCMGLLQYHQRERECRFSCAFLCRPSPLNFQGGTTDSIGHVGGLLAGVGYYMFRRYRIF